MKTSTPEIRITGRKTPPHKLATRDAAIRRCALALRGLRNDRTIASEGPQAEGPVLPRAPLPFQEQNALLQSWLRANAWTSDLSEDDRQALIDAFWRYAQGAATWRAFLSYADNIHLRLARF